MGPERVVDLTAPAFEQGVVNHHDDRRVRVQQPIDDHPGAEQPQPVDVPHRVGEEAHAAWNEIVVAIRAPASMPTTLRRPVCATMPVASTQNRANVPRRRNAGRNGSNTATHDEGKITTGR
jgi:hypothetical protein